jgi:putative membrane protein
MSIKPFKKVVDEELDTQKESQERVKPFKVQKDMELDIECNELEINDVDKIKDESSMKSIVEFLSSFHALVLAFIAFVFIATIVDAVDTVQELISVGSVDNYFYLMALTLLIIVISLNIYKNIKQIVVLKNIKNMKEKFSKQKEYPSSDIIPLANELISIYSSSKDKEIKQSIEKVEDELNSSQIYTEIYKDLDEVLLSNVDKKAQALVKNASLQAALTTAISPIAIVDIVLVVWRSFLLTKDISMLYGFKPGMLSSVSLLKMALHNVVFAGAAELASEYASEAAGSTILSKLSYSATQGLSNGILIARLGYGIIEACRPIPTNKKRESFVSSLIPSIVKAFRTQERVKA